MRAGELQTLKKSRLSLDYNVPREGIFWGRCVNNFAFFVRRAVDASVVLFGSIMTRGGLWRLCVIWGSQRISMEHEHPTF